MKKFLLTITFLLSLYVFLYSSGNDSFEITCSPIVFYSIEISTPAEGLVFYVEPNTSYVYPSTVTIKNTGNVSCDLTIRAYPLDVWQIGDQPALDTVRLLGVLKSSIADITEFDPQLDVIKQYENNMKFPNYSVDIDADNIPKNESRLLSIRLDSPTDTTVDILQRFKVEIIAYPASKF